jgi:hypothetical protein
MAQGSALNRIIAIQETMPLTPYLNGRAFNPETLKCMGSAFDAACKELGLTDRTDSLTELVAESVIALARVEECDALDLKDRVLRSLSMP